MTENVHCAVNRIAGAMLALVAISAPAQPFPTKPIRFLVGFVPGGSVDILARDLAAPLTQSLGQQVIIDNRGGAAGLLAAEATGESRA
jgi:tripartite-type tricarboxylate transporter receptor subunit TctC